MAANKIEGSVSYVNHEKGYVMIEYVAGGEKAKPERTHQEFQPYFYDWRCGRFQAEPHSWHG